MRKKTGQTEKSEKAKIVGPKARKSRSPIDTATQSHIDPFKKGPAATREERPIEASSADQLARRVKMKTALPKEGHDKDQNTKAILPNIKEKVKSVISIKENISNLNENNIIKKVISGKKLNRENSLISPEIKPSEKKSIKKEVLKTGNLDDSKSLKGSKNSEPDDLLLKKIFHLESIISDISESVSEKNKIISSYESKIKMMSAIASDNEDDIRKLKEDNNIYSEELKISKSKINENSKEIASLTRMLKFSEHEISLKNEQNSWMREVISKVLKMPKGWRFLTERQVAERIHRRLKRSDLFDADHYLELYSDVREIGMDPLQHYILHGMNENRLKKP